MKYLVKNKKLRLNYKPGMGAWTFNLVIPGTKNLKGSWGYIKVQGKIDSFKIDSKNLFPRKGKDMLISVNAEMRKAIGKKAGEYVDVTLKLIPFQTSKSRNVPKIFSDI